MEIDEKVVPLEASLSDVLPFCSGVLPVTLNDLALYYGQGENARHVYLNSPPANVLEELMNTCEPAQFGRGNENVFDESYRKAGQLKADAFRPMLDVRSVGLIRLISEMLLGNSEAITIHAELYNLNVYGQGSFFKAHVDTPRGKNMFGSLVVFYPTTHEGGAIVLRKNGQEWTYDSSQVLGSDGKTQLGYVALYSDVEHEVLPVTSGHRVSITYNLYFDDPDSASPLPAPFSSSSKASRFKGELQKLLDDPDFLPKGGSLGFGLEYTYPAHISTGRDISDLGKYLKGVDANVLQCVNEFGLESSFWGVIKKPDDGIVACKGEIPKVEGLEFGGDTYEIYEYLSEQYNTRILYTEGDASPVIPVTWVKIPEHWHHQMIINYGNESSVGYTYHAVCLIVEVGGPGDRMTLERPKNRRRVSLEL